MARFQFSSLFQALSCGIVRLGFGRVHLMQMRLTQWDFLLEIRSEPDQAIEALYVPVPSTLQPFPQNGNKERIYSARKPVYLVTFRLLLDPSTASLLGSIKLSHLRLQHQETVEDALGLKHSLQLIF